MSPLGSFPILAAVCDNVIYYNALLSALATDVATLGAASGQTAWGLKSPFR